jgi:hypothetical protein
MWCAEKPLCKTVADWEVFKIGLPEIYSKYTVVESFADVNTVQETHWL